VLDSDDNVCLRETHLAEQSGLPAHDVIGDAALVADWQPVTGDLGVPDGGYGPDQGVQPNRGEQPDGRVYPGVAAQSAATRQPPTWSTRNQNPNF
jgi:hypothetical protein